MLSIKNYTKEELLQTIQYGLADPKKMYRKLQIDGGIDMSYEEFEKMALALAKDPERAIQKLEGYIKLNNEVEEIYIEDEPVGITWSYKDEEGGSQLLVGGREASYHYERYEKYGNKAVETGVPAEGCTGICLSTTMKFVGSSEEVTMVQNICLCPLRDKCGYRTITEEMEKEELGVKTSSIFNR